MKRQKKEEVVAALHEKLKGATVAALSDYSGMNVQEIREVKSRLREAGGEFRVVKNRLALRASVGTPLEKVRQDWKGPLALTLGFGEPLSPVKAFNGLLTDQEKLKMKVAIIENRRMDRAGLQAVAKLPGRKEMLGQWAIRLKSPLYGVVGVLGGPLGKFVRTLHAVKTWREQKEADNGSIHDDISRSTTE